VLSQITVAHSFYIDETLTDATGSVTYTVTRLDGTAVTSGTATHGGTGVYSFVLGPQAAVDLLVVTWSGTWAGGAVTVIDYVEIVGGFIVSLGDIRNAKPVLDAVRYATADLIAARLEAEVECEDICHKAFVPRFARIKLTGNNMYALPVDTREVRKIRAVSVDGVALSAGDLANVAFNDSGMLSRWGSWWRWGQQGNVIIELEHGLSYPPEYIRKALIVRARSLLNTTDTKVPNRAQSFTVQDGGTYKLTLPTENTTGIPYVDAAYARADDESGGFA